MSPIKTLPLRIACDGESASGKSLAAKLISKKYKLFCMNSGLLFRYASRLIIKRKPKKIITFLRKKFRNLNYKHVAHLNLHSQKISNYTTAIAIEYKLIAIARISLFISVATAIVILLPVNTLM